MKYSFIARAAVLSIALVPVIVGQNALGQVNGSWNVNLSGTWSGSSNWASGTVPGGAGSIVNFSNNITATRTVTIDTTSRTVGVLNIGDSNGTNRFALAASGGASLIMNNGLSAAEINFLSSGTSNVISAPISLQSSLAINNSSSFQQEFSGGISAASGARIITNSGTGSGMVRFTTAVTDGSGVISLHQNSATSVLSLEVTNSFTGGVTVSQGRLRVAGGVGRLGTGTLTLNGGAFSAGIVSNAVTIGGNVTLGDAVDSGLITFSGTTTLTGNRTLTLASDVLYNNTSKLTGAYGITKEGSGVLTLASAASDFSGGVTLNNGTLRLGDNGVLGSGPLELNGGSLSSSGAAGRTVANSVVIGGNVTLGDTTDNGALTFNGSGTLTGNRTLTVASSVRYDGVISGAGNGLTKAGSGTMTLTNVNTYSGATTVTAGTLVLSGMGSVGSSSVVRVEGGAFLNASAVTGGFQLRSGQKFESEGTFIGSLTALDGSTYAPGNSPGIATQNGDLTLNTGSNFEWELIANTESGAGTNFDQTVFLSGGLNIQTGVAANLIFDQGSTVDWSDSFWASSRQWLIFSGASSLTNVDGFFTTINVGLDSMGVAVGTARGGSSFSFSSIGNDVYLDYNAVPEPSTWALLAGGLTALFIFRRRPSQ